MSSSIRAGALRIILPALPNVDPTALADLAVRLAGPDGELVLLGVVQVTLGDQLAAAAEEARRLRTQLGQVASRLPRDQPREILVRAADTIQAGIQQECSQSPGLLLIGLPESADARLFETPLYAELLAQPVIDTVFVRAGPPRPVQSVMLSARGGPHAVLALDLAGKLGRSYGAGITLVHVDAAGTNSLRRRSEQHLFHELLARASAGGKVRTASLAGHDVEATIISEARRHDLLIVGTHVGAPQSAPALGAVPEAALNEAGLPLVIVRSKGNLSPAAFGRTGRGLDELVNAWFVENTAQCREYSDLRQLVAAKQRRNLTLAAVVLEGSSADTLAAHARVLREELQQQVPLLDEVSFACGAGSAAAGAAAAAGFTIIEVPQAGADERGRLIHAAVRRSSADIIAWLDADTRNPHPKVVYGLVGPLLLHPHLRAARGFFGLPREAPDSDLRTLVGELTARPLIDIFLPELAGFIAPMTMEHACWRRDVLATPLFSGPAAPLGLLIDSVERLGLSAIAQVGLDEHMSRPLQLQEAARLAFSATQVLSRRAGQALAEPMEAAASLKRLNQTDGEIEIAVIEAGEVELSPTAESPEP